MNGIADTNPAQAALRARMEARARRDKLPAISIALWQELDEDGWVERGLSCGADEDEFYAHIKERLRSLRRSSTTESPQRRSSLQLEKWADVCTDYELRRAIALSRYLEALAGHIPRVRSFWAKTGLPIGGNEARSLLASPAAQCLSIADFQRLNVPVCGHAVRVVRETISAHRVVRLLTFEGQEEEIEVSGPWAQLNKSGNIEPLTGLPPFTLNPIDVPSWEQLKLPADSTLADESRLKVWGGSVLAELAGQARWLAGRFDWTEGDATRFLLTGLAPTVRPISLSLRFPQQDAPFAPGGVEITLTVQPWVSQASMGRYYRGLRKRLGNWMSSRPVETKTLEMFSFASERRLADPDATWELVLGEWNATHPEAPYSSVQTISEAYRIVERTLRVQSLEDLELRPRAGRTRAPRKQPSLRKST